MSSLEGLSTEGYTASVTVMPPGVSEYAGLAFAVRGESSRILFYVYRPAGANRFGKQCSIGVEGYIGGRKIRATDIRVREIDLELNTPIKISARQVSPNVTLSINDQNIGRFREQALKPGKVGVYGKSQHGDGGTATVKFDSFETE